MKFVVCVLTFFTLTAAVIQEITFHNCNPPGQAGCDSCTFRNPVSTAADRINMTAVQYMCYNTNMKLYSAVDFLGDSYTFAPTSVPTCQPINVTTIKSFRFFGNPDTQLDAISFYPEKNLKGAGDDFKQLAFILKIATALSLGYTGKSGYTLFEQDDFTGPYTCLPPATGADSSILNNLDTLTNITKIASGAKGCQPVTRQMREAFRRQVLPQ